MAIIELTRQDLEDLNYGACVFAAGGGGAFGSGQQLLELVDKQAKRPRLAALEDVASEHMGAVVAGVGSPEAFARLMDAGHYASPGIALDLLQKTLDLECYNFVAANETGCNIFIAMLAAQSQNIVLVDGNGAGRAVPKMDMLTYTQNVPGSPTTVANEPPTPEQIKAGAFSAAASLTAPSMADMELLLRPIVSIDQFGGVGAVATWSMNGDLLRKQGTIIEGAISQALNLGRAMRAARETKSSVGRAVVDHLGSRAEILMTGTLTDIRQTTKGGFDFGELEIAGTGESAGTRLTILNQNENLLCWSNKSSAPLVLAPDLISYLVGSDGTPYTNSDLTGLFKKGVEWANKNPVTVLKIECDSGLRTPEILSVFKSAVADAGYNGTYP